jgi:hypothetical protein
MFWRQTLGMATAESPDNLVFSLSQIMAQAEELGDYIFDEDGTIHLDDAAIRRMNLLEGVVRKTRQCLHKQVMLATDEALKDTG